MTNDNHLHRFLVRSLGWLALGLAMSLVDFALSLAVEGVPPPLPVLSGMVLFWWIGMPLLWWATGKLLEWLVP